MNDSLPVKNNSKSRRTFLQTVPKLIGLTALFAAAGNIFTSNVTKAQDKPESVLGTSQWIGEITLIGFNFAPNGWAFCNGQLLPISQNTALFSLLGTTYGGNGTTTFALPDLRDRFPIHPGNEIVQGEIGGASTVTLLTTEIPAHNHSLNVSTLSGSTDNPSTNFMAVNSEGIKQYSTTTNASANSTSIGSVGGNQPHQNMPPYLGINYVIALVGIFPSRS